MTHSALASRRARPARGLSLVELLVGVTLGLFILAGATMVATDQIVDNRRLLMETQVQQDMRAAMDIIVRDIRRSGFSYGATKLPAVGGTVTPYAYQSAGSTAAAGDPPSLLSYNYSTDATDNGTADSGEFKGFRQNGNVLQVQLGLGNWQPLTDSEVVKITSFTAVPNRVQVDLPPTCESAPCPAQSVMVNTITVTIVGEARHDPRVKRTLVTNVRVRNDEVRL